VRKSNIVGNPRLPEGNHKHAWFPFFIFKEMAMVVFDVRRLECFAILVADGTPRLVFVDRWMSERVIQDYLSDVDDCIGMENAMAGMKGE